MVQEKGEIYRISGPVVTTIGLKTKMYDLVKVGFEGLMGEVIGIKQDKSIIQVYEDTSGIRPGEPVINTGMPLSVLLGPGLLSSIYDGIQRPLPVLKQKMGDFIKRGVFSEGLDLEKLWEFKPVVSKGRKIGGGDVIGKVQETENIVHNIMVPPNIEGTIDEIYEGKYKVNDPICILHDGTKLTMMQKWPVRHPRPVKKKLMPNIPLITGQRILDGLFPVAKGGTAAIPGPFGSGKCVTGDTPIMLANGILRTMKEVYENNKKNGAHYENIYEEWTHLNNSPIPVISFNHKLNSQGLFASSADTVYKGITSSIIRIKTRTGRIAEVTPIHKLFAVTQSLEIREVEARTLKVGDYLLTPRKINLKVDKKASKINAYSMFNEARVYDTKILIEIRNLIKDLCNTNNITMKTLAEQIGVSYNSLLNYYYLRTKPTVSFVKTLYEMANKKVVINNIGGSRKSNILPTLRLPEVNKEFAEFLGLLLGDGTLKSRSVVLYNNDEKILDRFEELASKLFGLNAKRDINNTVKCSIINSSVLVKLMLKIGLPSEHKSRQCRVLDIIMQSKEEILSAFLGAYFLCDGYVGDNDLEIGTASKDMQVSISYSLLRLGILHTIAYNESTKNYRIFIRGKDEIEKFYKHCKLSSKKFSAINNYLKDDKRGYTTIDIVPIAPKLVEKIYNEMNRPYTFLKENGIEIHNYIGNNESMSAKTFKKFAVLSNNSKLRSFAETLEFMFCDQIIEIESLNSTQEVYDITVPNTHNFVGGFGAILLHNTVTQQQLAKWSDTEIVVYIGCGERGNEMSEVLEEFPKLEDPKTGRPLMERTVLIANTSNMPVAAREASIYTGITIAEYYRDMGYDVSLMADSTSRWAEAMREISSRLEEMPGEEGYPAYLAARLSDFYERAGRVVNLNGSKGSVTIIGAVSPPGGDFSEPVTQNTLRIVKVFWALDAKLAQRRHFPSINWLDSYSLYLKTLEDWYNTNVSPEWTELREEAMETLQKESELQEIVQLVGSDALPEDQQLTLEIARMFREYFLQQNAYHPIDTYCTLEKQYKLLKAISKFAHQAYNALDDGVPITKIIALKSKDELAKVKFEKDFDNKLESILKEMDEEFRNFE